MAEMIPFGIVERVISRLASLAFHEIAQIYGVESDVEKLRDTVELIRAVLLDADQKQQHIHVIRIWIRRLKQVLHNADDLFDALMAQEMRRKMVISSQGMSTMRKVRGFFSSSNQIAFRIKMSHEIKKIQQQFAAVKEDVSHLELSQRVVVLVRHGDDADTRETSSSVLESNIIGRDSDKSEIVNLLLHTHVNDQNVSFIALVGIGGLGKTALAQFVYNDAEVKRSFQKQIWVCVSEEFEVKTLVKKILESLTSDQVNDLQLEVLKNKLQEHLKGQRYLLVLDDVWNENPEKWILLQTILICGAQGSKVLVTTRSQTVSKTMGASTSYVLKGLTKEQSWDLLKNMAFGKDGDVIQHLVSVGEKIAEKCRGVPLAIKSVGGLLQSKTKESEWLKVLHGELHSLCEEEDNIMPILKLSYDNLPIELRQCFVYCSLYPKDYKIYKDELIQLWIAQGYLDNSRDRQDLEDIGDEYVQILLMKSFFQDLEVNKTANVIPSLDLADVNKVRTILWPGKQNWKLAMARLLKEPHAISNLKRLRVLDLSMSSITELPKSIGKLNHLRYLNLSHCNQLISLPKSIGNLVNLQTLKLEACGRLEFSIDAITKLINLRHLMIDSCKAFQGMMPFGLGKLTSLHYLSTFRVGHDDGDRKSAKLNELKEIDDLRHELCIKNLDRVRDVEEEAKDVNLRGKKHLWSLDLSWTPGTKKDNDTDSVVLLEMLCPNKNLKQLSLDYFPGVRVASWFSSLTNIVQMTFFGCVNCRWLPPLEQLPSLKYLSMNGMDSLQYIEYDEIPTDTSMFFASLEDLNIYNCPNLKGWKKRMLANEDDVIELPPFPRLSLLTIRRCRNLTRMPKFPHLVEELVLGSCSVEPLIETILGDGSSSTAPLSALKYMRIHDIHTEALPEDWMQNLTCLQRLEVVGIPSLQHMQHLPHEASLQELLIREMGDNLDCQFLPCIDSLQTLTISHCNYLEELPQWICSFPQLRLLHIHYCRRLGLLPEAISSLANLYTLEIVGCPLLHERCNKQTGADWHKIAHISLITLND
ncbi:hypothetical protein PIB30_027553 [Stylosanthes scabra]|uniref:Uncharacterized protein n=1 Tax=Stylosanthes scabra TaxID=79078 RepID=A0ABU6VDR3_9FABA|nr:hypothetical protein [Stylosanthes scabra]